MNKNLDSRCGFQDNVATMMNELAQELNDALAGTTAGSLLSDMGRRLYFPRGIIAQSG